jgi:predicted transcriptional regulator of viral defense system
MGDERDIERDLLQKASLRRGLLRRRDVLDAGFSAGTWNDRVRTGRWVRMSRGVYRVLAVPDSWEQRLLAPCLDSGGVASHRSAAALHRLAGFSPGIVEVTVGHGRRRSDRHVVWHESRVLRAEDCSTVDGLPTTNVLQTLFDIGSVAPKWQIETALDDALRRRLVSVPDIETALANTSRRGRRGHATLREVLEPRLSLRTTESPLESRFLRLLKQADLAA